LTHKTNHFILSIYGYIQEVEVSEYEIEKDKNILSPKPPKDITIEMKLLARTWVDDFERESFNGKTLDELLNQRKYV